MKKKRATYLLIGGVLAIWGLLIWKIASAIAPREEEPSGRLPVRHADYSRLAPRDTETLHLDYRDPFLTKSDESNKVERKSLGKRAGVSDRVRPLPMPEDISFIHYKGIFMTLSKNRYVIIMGFHDREEMMKQGQTVSGVRVVAIRKENVNVLYHGKQIKITKD